LAAPCVEGIDGPLLTRRQRQKVQSEILSLIGPATDVDEAETIRFVAIQVGRQTAEEVAFCKRDARGRP
jgi:hypothetical protein